MRIRRLHPIFFVLVAALALLAVTYTREMRRVSAQDVNAWREDQVADCAVVVTGGPGRVREGIDLLARGSVKKLIISGVHPQAELVDIFPQWVFFGSLNSQDVVLEKRSRTTFGNAQQSLPLVEAMRCRDLLLVTSRLHMYRAVRTFRAEFPTSLPIYAHAVSPGLSEAGRVETALEAMKSLFYSIWAY